MTSDDPIGRAIELDEMTPDAVQAILSGEAIATEEARVVTRRFLESLIGRRKAGRPSGTVPSTADQQGYARFLHRSQHMAFADIKDRVPGLSDEQIFAAIGKFANGRITKAAKIVATKLMAMKSE